MKIHSHSPIILLAIIAIIIIFGVAYFQMNQWMSTNNNQAIKNENTQSGALQSGGLDSSWWMITDLSWMTHQEKLEAYKNKWMSLDRLWKFQEAIDAYNKAIELDPEYVNAYYNKWATLYRLKKYQEALDTIDIGLKNISNDPVLLEARKKIISAM